MSANLNTFEVPGWLLNAGRQRLDGGGRLRSGSGQLRSGDAGRRRRAFAPLIDGYERRVDDLTLQVHTLRDEVMKLRRALAEAHLQNCFGA
jgi:hypothetical protein